jgi:transcriptional regulator
VAREAEVDPALVHHYFSSKENLFFASMEIGIDPDKVFKHATELGTSALGRRLASLIVRIWESSTGEGILNSFLDAPGTIQLYGSVVERQMGRAFDLFFPGHTAAKLEALAQVQAIVSGMVLTRYALRLKAATSLSSAQAIRMYGDLIQSVIDRTVEDLEA